MKSPKPVQPKAVRSIVIIPVTSLEMFLKTRRGIMPSRMEPNPKLYCRKSKWGREW